jgi:putative tryptophan/tyrosine transport system substrate-binding protein
MGAQRTCRAGARSVLVNGTTATQAVRDDPDPFNTQTRATTFALAAKYRLPAIYPNRPFAVDGGLMSYGTDAWLLFRDSATYIDRILRGTNLGELPVQFATKFELVINLKTAKALGLTIPETLLATADEVIQ